MNLKSTLITITIIFCLFSNSIAKSSENYYNEGNKNFLKKEYEKAIENYNKAVELDKNNPDYRCALGIALGAVRKYKEAINEFVKIINSTPDYESAYYFLYFYSYNSDIRRAECIKILSEHIKKHLKVAFAHLALANLLYEDKQYDNALESYKKAIEYKSDYSDAYYGIGAVYLQKEDYRNAINNFKKAIEIFPDYALAHYGMSLAYKGVGEDSLSESEMQMALKIDPDIEKLGLLRTRDTQCILPIISITSDEINLIGIIHIPLKRSKGKEIIGWGNNNVNENIKLNLPMEQVEYIVQVVEITYTSNGGSAMIIITEKVTGGGYQVKPISMLVVIQEPVRIKLRGEQEVEFTLLAISEDSRNAKVNIKRVEK